MGSLEKEMKPIEINFIRSRGMSGAIRTKLPAAALVIFVLSAVVWLGWKWLDAYAALQDAKWSLKTVEERISNLQAQELSLQPSIVSELLQLSDELKTDSVDPVELIRKLTVSLPDHMNISSITVQENGSMKLTALFADASDIASFIRLVRHTGDFHISELGRVEKIGVAAPAAGEEELRLLLPLQTTLELSIKSSVQAEGSAP
ncbi:hypothetical protein D3C78_874410 [compost metagenome]